MSRTLKVVAVLGSVQQPSRTLALVKATLALIEQQLPVEVRLIELSDRGPQFAGVLTREQLPQVLQDDLEAIESADLLIAASPVYRASYTGLFKHLFDFVHYQALQETPVLLLATGGSERHALVIDHQLRPLFGFFQAHSLPLGIYAAESDFVNYQLVNPGLQERLSRAVEAAVKLFEPARFTVSVSAA